MNHYGYRNPALRGFVSPEQVNQVRFGMGRGRMRGFTAPERVNQARYSMGGFTAPQVVNDRRFGMGQLFTGSRPGERAFQIAMPVVNLVTGPMAIASMISEAGGGTSHAQRMNSYMAMYQQAKEEVSNALKKIVPDFNAVDTQAARVTEILAQVENYASGSNEPAVSDALWALRDVAGQISDAIEATRSQVDELNSLAEEVKSGEAAGQVMSGQQAQVALDRMKRITRELTPGLKLINSKLQSFQKALSRASAVIKRDYDKRRAEEEAARQYQDYLDQQERQRQLKEEQDRLKEERERQRLERETQLQQQAYDAEIRRQEQLDAAQARRDAQASMQYQQLTSIRQQTLEDQRASWNPSWDSAGSGVMPYVATQGPTRDYATGYPQSVPDSPAPWDGTMGYPAPATGIAQSPSGGQYAIRPPAESAPEIYEGPDGDGNGTWEPSLSGYGMGSFMPYNSPDLRARPSNFGGFPVSPAQVTGPRFSMGGFTAPQIVNDRRFGMGDLATDVRARVRDLIEAGKKRAQAEAEKKTAAKIMANAPGAQQAQPVSTTSSMSTGAKILLALAAAGTGYVVVKKLAKKGR